MTKTNVNTENHQESRTDHAHWVEAFRPQATFIRRLHRTIAIAAGGFCLSFAAFFVGSALHGGPWLREVLMIPAVGSMIVIIVGLELLERRLRCPACQRRLMHAIGTYCPSCGHHPLPATNPCETIPTSECPACAQKIHWGKARNFSLRHCTHCGVLLHEDGLRP